MIPQWLQLALLVVSPAFAAGGAYMAVKVRLDWHAKRLDEHDERLKLHDQILMR